MVKLCTAVLICRCVSCFKGFCCKSYRDIIEHFHFNYIISNCFRMNTLRVRDNTLTARKQALLTTSRQACACLLLVWVYTQVIFYAYI